MLLSFVIPTRNRAPFLDHCLQSIAAQRLATDEYQVVVSDNASTDATAEVVERHRAAGVPITYSRHDADVGFDRNFEHALKLAEARYIWSIGDDDWLEPSATDHIQRALAMHPDAAGMTVRCNTYSVDGLPVELGDEPFGVAAYAPARSALLVPVVAHAICNMTLNIVRADLAHAALRERPLARNACAAHDLVLRVIARGEAWLAVDARAAAWRFGNDSFMAAGLLRRMNIAMDAYTQNIRDVFGERSDVRECFEADVLPGLALGFVLRSKNIARYARFHRPYVCPSSERRAIAWAATRRLVTRGTFWRRVLPAIVAPKEALRLYASLRDRLDERQLDASNVER